MNLAILFWFYKDIDVCVNRLQFLKRQNPDAKIYGLYGWPKEDVNIFQDRLQMYLDDFYMAPMEESFWKWINWDLVLLDWFEKRGKNLERDSVFIAQWDLLIFSSLEELFAWIKKDEIYFPYYESIDNKIESEWYWTSERKYSEKPETHPKKPYMRKSYLAFKELVAKKYGYNNLLPRSIFMLAILPRVFFEKYSSLPDKEVGFLEYKLPTYAKIFGLSLFPKDLWESVLSQDVSEWPMNAKPMEIEDSYIQKELEKKDGWRVFHPYFKVYW